MVSLHNNVNIITYHIYSIQQKTAHGIMPPQKEKGLISGSLVLEEKPNNSPKYSGIYIKSTTNRKIQQGSSRHTPKRQEHFQKNIQENMYIFNQIRHIQEIGNKLIIIP